MDLSRFCTDDQTQSPSGLTDSQTKDLDVHSLLHSRTENMLCAYSTGTEIVSDFSDPTDKSTEALAKVSKCLLFKETGTRSDCSKPSSFSYDMSESFSLNSEPALKDDDFMVHGCFGSSKPVLPLPQLSHEIISPTYTKHESGITFSLTQDNITSQPFGDMPFVPGGLLEPSISEPLFSYTMSAEHTEDTDLKRLLSSESDILEHDTAIAPVSDLYIFESETQDFVLSRNVDPWEIKCPEYWPLSQTGKKEAHGTCDTHVLMCDSSDMVTHCHYNATQERAMVDYESDGIQHIGLKPPAVNACEVDMMLVNDVREGEAEVTGLTHQPWRNDSPNELWLDACQYLAGEDDEDKDAMSHSLVQGALSATSDLSFLPGEMQGSGYSPEGSCGIGWSSDDTRSWGPPVERWSSVDSWASALSDWTGIITVPPEDLTAAFTEIGAEIDALTQALAKDNTYIESEPSKEERSQETAVETQSQPLMGVQDQPVGSQNITESSTHYSQSCLSLCLRAEGPEHQDGAGSQSVESVCDSTPTTQGERESKNIQSSQTEWFPSATHWLSSTDSSSATAASCGGGAGVTDVPGIPGSTSYAELDLPHFGEYVESLDPDSFISNDKDPIILNIIEDSDLEVQNATAEPVTKKPIRDGLCEVTDERSISQLGLVTEQEAKRSSGPAGTDVKGTESSPDLHLLTTHTLTNSQVRVVDTQPDLDFIVLTPDLFPDIDGAYQVEPQCGSPKYVIALASLSIGSSLVCQTSSSLDGHQTCAKRSLNDNTELHCVQPCVPQPTSDGITHTPSLEGDEEDIYELSRELSNLAVVPADHFIISKENRVACITLDLNDPFVSRVAKPIDVQSEKTDLNKKTEKMPHKTHKNTSESKTRPKKDKSGGHHHHTAQASKKQENVSPPVSAQQTCKQQDTLLTEENHTREYTPAGFQSKDDKLVIETSVAADKVHSKPHSKKKKKHGLNATPGKSSLLVEVENGAKPKSAKGKIDMFEAKLGAKAGEAKKNSQQSDVAEKKPQQMEAKASQEEKPPHQTGHKDHQPNDFTNPLKDDVIKRRRLSEHKFSKIVSVLESKLTNADVSAQVKEEESKVATHKKSYSEVVKQKIPPKEDIKVVQPIQAVSVSGDPQSLCLWCQFAAVTSDQSVTWSREGTVLAEIKRSAGDESRVSFTIPNASHKDLGKYQCQLSSLQGSLTLDYLLTYEVLSEIVIPSSPKTIASAPVTVGTEEEDVHCSRLMFKEDLLSDQYFGENHLVSIITEKVHFGEGMHRRAFRTKLQAGQIPLLELGHPCVLKVHNAISYGIKNNDELIKKNFSLAVEECQVQNTAREYIKSYTAAAQSAEAFGDVPEIIPIYLVHRPSNDIPYATLEEELIGDFVKYSVKDGKEINLMRRDSEAGKKCCTFQHWVYHKTEGNLLVTDMQGVGMRLTDVGIATCKKGYKGFKGNCATSFIDQFKALHQCNTYCEILGLTSLQPKPKKPASAPKAKPQHSAAPKKKTFGPTVKGKS